MGAARRVGVGRILERRRPAIAERPAVARDGPVGSLLVLVKVQPRPEH